MEQVVHRERSVFFPCVVLFILLCRCYVVVVSEGSHTANITLCRDVYVVKSLV